MHNLGLEIKAECFFCIGKPSCYRFSSFLVASHFLFTVFLFYFCLLVCFNFQGLSSLSIFFCFSIRVLTLDFHMETLSSCFSGQTKWGILWTVAYVHQQSDAAWWPVGCIWCCSQSALSPCICFWPGWNAC